MTEKMPPGLKKVKAALDEIPEGEMIPYNIIMKIEALRKEINQFYQEA